MSVPAIPALLILGLAMQDPIRGAIAAGAAFSIGFGASRDLKGRRWAAMIAAAIGMTIAAFVGTLAGERAWVLVPLAALAAGANAAIALFDEDLWWVTLQVAIALLVAGYYPGPPAAALSRAITVLLGAVVQMAFVIALARLFPAAAARLPRGAARPPPERALLIRHVVRAAICVVLSLSAALALGLANSYWAPMTAMIVLKPGLHDTQARGTARLIGTLAGCAGASVFAILVHYSPLWLLGGLAMTSGSAFALQKAHYATLTSAITATVVLLLSIGHGQVLLNAEHRIVATLLGGVIALLVARVAPHRPGGQLSSPDHVGA